MKLLYNINRSAFEWEISGHVKWDSPVNFVGLGSIAPCPDVPIWFQSLFSWKYLLEPGPQTYCQSGCLVSILVFVEVSLRVHLLGLANIHGELFQSLFSWKYLLEDGWGNISCRLVAVSILVFVEVSLRVYDILMTCNIRWVSILVFVEVSLRAQLCVHIRRL